MLHSKGHIFTQSSYTFCIADGTIAKYGIPSLKYVFFRASNSKNSCSYDRLKIPFFFSRFFITIGRRQVRWAWSSPTSPHAERAFRSSVWLRDFTEAGHTYESHWHGFVGTDLSVVGFHHHFPRPRMIHPLDLVWTRLHHRVIISFSYRSCYVLSTSASPPTLVMDKKGMSRVKLTLSLG